MLPCRDNCSYSKWILKTWKWNGCMKLCKSVASTLPFLGLFTNYNSSQMRYCTLKFLINVPVRLLIFEQFSHQYALIRTSTFIFYEQLMILYTCTWPIFMRNYIFEAIILHQYAYLDQYVYWIWQNFPPVLLFGPVRLLRTLE